MDKLKSIKMDSIRNKMANISLVGDAYHFDDQRNKLEDIRKLLDSKSHSDKMEAMKTLIAMMTIGRDVSAFFPDVVKNVVAEEMDVKKLVYMYVIHYGSKKPDLALLSVAPFQKDLQSTNPLTRASALKALTSMRVPVIVPIILIALGSAVKDSSAYVRKSAAHAIPKIYTLCRSLMKADEIEPSQRAQLVEHIEKLLEDREVMVLSGALYAFMQICGPGEHHLLHKPFKKICHLLADMDEWGQCVCLKLLLYYCRKEFANPEAQAEEEEYDSDEDEKLLAEINPDLKTAIKVATNLIHTTNNAVMLSIMSFLFHCAPRADCIIAVKLLVTHLRTHKENRYIILANIGTMAETHPELFIPHYKSFFVRSGEPECVKELKLDIMSKLATESNVAQILGEFRDYTLDWNLSFRCATVEAIGRCAAILPTIAESCLRLLMNLVQTASPEVAAKSIVVMRQLIQKNPAEYPNVIKSLIRLLDKIEVPAARATIIWIIGEYRNQVSEYAPDCLRKLAISFREEDVAVKLQTLNLAVKLFLSNPSQTKKLFKYILDLGRYDTNYDLRDRCRMVRAVFWQNKKAKGQEESETSQMLRTKLQEMFLVEKPVPVVESPFKDRDRFVLGTLSHAVVHSAGTRYESLPDWPAVPPDHDLRDQGEPMVEEKINNRFSSSRPKDTEAFLNEDDDAGSSFKSGYSSSMVSSGSQTTLATDADDTSQTTLTSSSEEDEEDDEEDEQENETKSEYDDEEDDESEEDGDSSEIVIMVPETKANKGRVQMKMEESSEEGSEDEDSVEEEDDDDVEEDVESSKPSRSKQDDFLLLFPEQQKANEQPKSAKAEALDAFDMMMGGPAAGSASANYSPMDDLLNEMNSRPKALAPQAKRSFSLPTVGACGVLLEEEKSEGLRVEYSYLRRESGFGKNYILVGLTLTNTGSESITNIKLQSVDQAVIKGFKPVDGLQGGELVSREISIELSGKNAFPMRISTQEEEHQCRLDVPFGEAMRPKVITNAEFLQNQQRLSGMQSQNKKRKGINLETAVAGFTRCFNVAAIQEDVGANYIARFASTLLSSKHTMLIELKEGRDKNSVSFHVNSEDFFELTTCITAISKIVF